jgi:hypothetical protein
MHQALTVDDLPLKEETNALPVGLMEVETSTGKWSHLF